MISRRYVFPYGQHWIDQNDIDCVTSALRGDRITQGSKIDEFEKCLADYCGVRYAVAVSSGTAALHAVCAVAGVSAGDEVITTPMTFVATANAIVYCGGTPVFADIEKDMPNINPNEIKKKITARTKAIIPVDFAGHPVDLDAIKAIAKDLIVIEDASHALGAEYKGRKVGSLADMTVFSFHPVKHITTGEGGAVLTNSEEFYNKLIAFRHHGLVEGKMYELGYNYRITDFQCALGISQMRKLDGFIERRREIAAMYNLVFLLMPDITIPVEIDYAKAAYHLYVIQVEDRDKMARAFVSRNISVARHYLPVYLHPFYQNTFGYKVGDYPNADMYYRKAVTLPMFPKMSDEDVNHIIGVVKEVMK